MENRLYQVRTLNVLSEILGVIIRLKQCDGISPNFQYCTIENN
jgi:hypothetical protein